MLFKEPASFYKLTNRGQDMCDVVEDGSVSYKLEGSCLSLIYEGKVIDSTTLNKGESVEIRVRDGETPRIVPCSDVNENVATMLPIVGLNGPVITKQVKDNDEDKNMEFEFNKALIDYIENPEAPYDINVSEGVNDTVLNFKTEVDVNRDIRKCILKVRTLEAKMKNSKNVDNKTMIDMKRDYVDAKKKLLSYKKGASDALLKEISKLDKMAKKEAEKYINPEAKTESVRDILLQSDSITESDNEPVEEATAVSTEGRINYWKQMINATNDKIKKLTDEKEINKLKSKIQEYQNKIDDIKKVMKDQETGRVSGIGFRGKMHSSRLVTASTDDTIQDLNDRLNYATEKFNETGDVRYEKMIRGLNAKIKTVTEKVKDESMNTKGDIFTESASDDIVEEAANMEDEIKPIVAEFERKGYKVKYASPGHTKLRKKEDKEPDGVFYGKLYSDARVMFDKKYDFPAAPKYWKWRDVDGCSYLDIVELSYTDKDITPDEAFSKWKTNYMNSLREYVKSLKPINQEVKESTFDTSLDFDEFYKELIYEMVD